MGVKTVVVDEGSSQCKLAWLEDGEIKTFISPSFVKLGRSLKGVDKLGNNVYKAADGEYYTVTTDTTDPLRNNNAQYQFSTHSRIAVHHALKEAGFGGQEVNIIVTLPIRQYFDFSNGGVINAEAVEKKKKNLFVQGDAEANGNNELAKINAIAVTCEGSPAFKTFESKLALNSHQVAGVVDIGDTTTDIAMFNGDGDLIDGRFRSVDGGVSKIRQRLQGVIKRDFDLIEDIPIALLDETLRTGKFDLGSGQKDYADQVKTFAESEYNRIGTELNDIFQDPKRLAHILVVGGGASLYGDIIKVEHSNAYIADNCETALAEGILRVVEGIEG